jgi:predicted transcriptional regulator
MTTLRIRIASYDEMKARTMAIARGEQRLRRDAPKIWFTSMERFARSLSDRNRALLALIAEAKPGSLAELATLSGRAKSNLSRTLKTMARLTASSNYGKARAARSGRVPYTDIALDVPLGAGA